MLSKNYTKVAGSTPVPPANPPLMAGSSVVERRTMSLTTAFAERGMLPKCCSSIGRAHALEHDVAGSIPAHTKQGDVERLLGVPHFAGGGNR